MTNSYTKSLAFLAVLLVLSLAALARPAAADCACGPDFCVGDSRYAAALAQKKKALSANGYPSRLINLLDRGGQCVARIQRAPDAFTILPVQPNGDNTTVSWDEDNERIARTQLQRGELKSYYIFNSRKSLACCGEKPAEQRPDWQADVEVSATGAIICTRVGSGSLASVQCTGG